MNHPGKQSISINRVTHKIGHSKGLLFGLLILGALLAFELFNYTTTDYALNDLLGGVKFAGIRWATILALAFCGIDFAGIARLFTPEKGMGEQKEVWYLFGAWLLAASMNAMLTWWGVALAIVNHQSLGSSVIDHETMLNIVPVFVAVMVWLIRVLIIGTFSVAGDRLYSQAEVSGPASQSPVMTRKDPGTSQALPRSASFRTVPKSPVQSDKRPGVRPDPTYHPASMSGYRPGENQTRH